MKRGECIHKLKAKPLSRPSLLIAYSAGRKLGGNFGARLFQTYKYAIVMIVTRSWACSMRLAVYAVTDSIIENLSYQV